MTNKLTREEIIQLADQSDIGGYESINGKYLCMNGGRDLTDNIINFYQQAYEAGARDKEMEGDEYMVTRLKSIIELINGGVYHMAAAKCLADISRLTPAIRARTEVGCEHS